jgi:hypothetical protein
MPYSKSYIYNVAKIKLIEYHRISPPLGGWGAKKKQTDEEKTNEAQMILG